MRKFKTMYSQGASRDLVPLADNIVTRPGQALTVEETIVMFQQRGTVRMNRGYHFYDDTIQTDTSKMTFEQLHDYSQQVARHAQKLALAAQSKAATDRESAIRAEVDKRLKEASAAQSQAAEGSPAQ